MLRSFRASLPLIFMIMTAGICTQKWEVQYSKTVICALKGSTIHLSGSYKHPKYVTVKETFWTVNPRRGKAINLLDLPEYKGRVEYFQTYPSFFLSLSDVRHEDGGMYCFRILAKTEKEHFLGHPGIEFRVTELSVEIPEEVVEGDSTFLTCKSTCTLTGSTNFTWYKNGESFSNWTGENQLFLQSVSSEDTGNYSCGVRDQKHLSSPALTLNVRYPPKSVSVSVRGSAEIVSGDSVTLSCISDSNPPALNFSWFKEETSLGSGGIYRITNITSEASGNYSCSAGNKHGSLDSSSVTVNVMYPPRNVSVFISGSAEIVSGDSVTLSCSSDSNPPALSFSWFKENQSSAVGSGQSFSALHSGQYYCKTQNPHGSQRSASVSVTVKGLQRAALLTLTGIVAGCGGLIFIFIIFIIVLIKKKRRDGGAEDSRQNQQDPIGRSAEMAPTNDSPVYSVVSDYQNEDLYAKVTAKKPQRCRRDSGEVDEVQYASVQHFNNKDKTEEHQKKEMPRLSDANRSEDIIYSSVK